MGHANQNKQTCTLIYCKRINKHSYNIFLKKEKKISLSCAVFTFFQVHSLLTYETISQQCLKKHWWYREKIFLEEKGNKLFIAMVPYVATGDTVTSEKRIINWNFSKGRWRRVLWAEAHQGASSTSLGYKSAIWRTKCSSSTTIGLLMFTQLQCNTCVLQQKKQSCVRRLTTMLSPVWSSDSLYWQQARSSIIIAHWV